MPGAPIQVGPFIGGLNTFSDPSAIADNELSRCENFELDLDGSLKSRPPIQDLNVSFPLTASGNVNLLGYYYATNNVPYLLASDGDSSTYYFDGNVWNLITNTVAAAGFTQFNDKAWLTAPVGSGTLGSFLGGTWDPVAGFVNDPAMPEGECITVYKDRLWVAEGRDTSGNGTRLYYSRTLADPQVWPLATPPVPPLTNYISTTDFSDIGSGDGQNIVQIAVYFNTLLIFRSTSIYGLQYASDPDVATISLVVPNVGLASKDAIDQFESYIYFMYEDKAYEFSNNRAQQINVKVPFEAGNTTGIYVPFAVSEFNRRIIFSYYRRTYVYSLRTRTWTEWKSSVFGPIGKVVRQETGDDTIVAVTHESTVVPAGGSREARTLFITDAVTNATEAMECVIQTKIFNYQASSIYKRLFWWGVDASFKGVVEGEVFPVTENFTVPWQNLLDNETWLTMLQYVWGQPQSEPPNVDSVVTAADSTIGRKFVKFFKSLRFRQVYFRVTFQTNGSTSQAPVRLFSLMTYVNPKQTVSTTIS
jgi:hypothetical protein